MAADEGDPTAASPVPEAEEAKGDATGTAKADAPSTEESTTRKRVSFTEEAKSPAKPNFKPSLRTGQRVILQGLEKAKELNGHHGVVVRWKPDAGRYAVRVAGKEMAIKPENLKTRGGAAEAEKWFQKYKNTEGCMYNPVLHARTPGAGPKVMQWIGQVKAGRRIIVKAERDGSLDDEPIPIWFGDRGFVGSAPVDVALLIKDIGAEPSEWPNAISRVLDRFPAAAGRLRSRRIRERGMPDQIVWQIVTNNAGVPFTTASVPPCGLPSSEELQLACHDEQCGYFDLGAMDGSEKDEDEPLLRLKLVYEEGTARGILGVSFNHVLCDISGIGALLQWLQHELDNTEKAPEAVPCFDRSLAEEAFTATAEATTEQEAEYTQHWPLHSAALERWCFFARRLRSGLRGKPDGVGTVCFSVPPATLTELKGDAEAEGATGASGFETLVCFIGMSLLRFGRFGRRVLVTKDYRAALDAEAPGQGLGQLFANVVTHGVSFELPDVADLETMPLAEACKAMRACIDGVSLGYVSWHNKQDHFRGLPNIFGGLCCNSWGRAIADLNFVENYAIGPRSVDERAANMAFPLDNAYMQVLPQPSGSISVLLTMPITDITAMLKGLPDSYFALPHISQMRVHSFRIPMPGPLVNKLNPVVETHHIFARIACIGDSMTACGYPKYLQALFDKAGIKAQVRSFGVAGTTAQKFADQPYWDEKKLEDARTWRPHFVISTFGSNDAKSGNWEREAFEKDYKDLCIEFLERNSPKPIAYLVVPPPLYEEDAYEMQQDVVNGELPEAVPCVVEAALAEHNNPIYAHCKKHRQEVPQEAIARASTIDAFTVLGGTSLRRRSYFAEDGVHLNERGTRLLALTVFAEMRQTVTLELRKRADAACKEEKDPLDCL